MLTQSDNDRLARVSDDAPMGRLMRENYWIPYLRSEALAAGAAPQRCESTMSVRPNVRSAVASSARRG